MGIYDREYYRSDESSRGGLLGADQPMVTNLIVVNVALFLVDYFSQGRLQEYLGLRDDLFTHPWNFYQLLTAGFMHSVHSVWHILFNMFGLWLFGRDVEAITGRRLFLQLYLSLVVCASTVWLVTQSLLHPHDESVMIGASGAVVGIMVIYGCHYPRRTFYIWGVLPMPAWLLIGLYVLQDLSAALQGNQSDNTAYMAHLGGAAFGFLYYRTGWYLGSMLPSSNWRSWLRPRPKLRVHRGEPRPAAEQDMEERLDAILDKIHRQGEASLSAEERRFLEDASRRYQQRKR